MLPAVGSLAALFVVVLICVALKVGQKRLAGYSYDVRQDARYDFARANPTRMHARIQDGRLDVPARLKSQNTVLLEVRVNSSILGYWFEPRVDIESDAGRISQAFERGGSGLRYVNLSPLDLNSPVSIRLRGSHLKIPDQEVTLDYLPSDLDIDRQRILVIGPHPDDAEIGAFGLYDGRDAYVVTVTAGDAGDPGIFSMFAGSAARVQKGRVRTWNSLVVPMLGGLGIVRTANLGYFDGTLSAMMANPMQPVHSLESGLDSLDTFRSSESADLIASRTGSRATWVNLVQDLEYLIKRVEPDIIVTPDPRLDVHPDHRFSTFALIEAIHNLHWTHGSLLLYGVHLRGSGRYPYGRMGDLVSLPPATGVVFDGIWSQNLSNEQQARKYMALDAMVDIRPNLEPASLRSVASLFKHALLAGIAGSDESYYRRAVRANELFFVLRVQSLYDKGVLENLKEP